MLRSGFCPTIRSRCRRLLLRPLEDRDVRAAIGSLGDALERIFRARSSIRLCATAKARSAGPWNCSTRRRSPSSTRSRKLLDGLPKADPKQILALAEALARRDADDSYELALETVQRWVSERLHERAGLGASRLAPLVEVCEKIDRSAREIDVFNLDRRPFILTMFDDLADAVRRAA